MSDNTVTEGTPPEENDIIKGLRAQLKTANAAVKTAGDDAIAKVKRSEDASSLMPDGFEGLADIYETEVDGELNAASAAEWLKGRGITAAPSENVEDPEASVASALEEVTNLGSAVAAAGNSTLEDTVLKQIADIDKQGTEPQTLADVTEALSAVLDNNWTAPTG